MTFEETLRAQVRAEVEPLREELRLVRTQLQAVLRALPPPLVTPRQAAERLGISLSTVRRRIRDHELPVRRLGRTVRVDLSGLHAPDDDEVARIVVGCKQGGEET